MLSTSWSSTPQFNCLACLVGERQHLDSFPGNILELRTRGSSFTPHSIHHFGNMPPSSRVPANLRSLLVKVSPAPATLSERRAILRVLKRHGEVDVFKKLHVRTNPINRAPDPSLICI